MKTQANNVNFRESVHEICYILPDILGSLCDIIDQTLGDYIADAYELGNTADTLCYCIGPW